MLLFRFCNSHHEHKNKHKLWIWAHIIIIYYTADIFLGPFSLQAYSSYRFSLAFSVKLVDKVSK